VVGPIRPEPSVPAQESRALRDLTLAVIIGLAGAITEDVIDLLSNVQSLVTATTTPNGAVVRLPSPWLWVVGLTAGGALALAEVLLVRRSFGSLRPVDARFAMPAQLSVLAAIGTLVALAGLALLLDGIYVAVGCAGPGHPLTIACLSKTGFVEGIVVLLVGVLVALVGYISILVGIWRFGHRYNVSLFKVGVLLLIFPILNAVGAVLILVGARKAAQRVRTGMGAPASVASR